MKVHQVFIAVIFFVFGACSLLPGYREFHLGFIGPYPELDPHRLSPPPALGLGTLEPQWIVARTFFPGLMGYSEKGELEPALALEVDVSSDGLLYSVRLRSALWSDGQQLTAQDVHSSWLRLLDLKTGSYHSELLKNVAGAWDYRLGERDRDFVHLKILDELTLEIGLKERDPLFLEKLAHPALGILPRHKIPYEDFFLSREQLVVSGPFKPGAGYRTTAWELKKNPSHWNHSRIGLQTLFLHFFQQSEEAKQAYGEGTLDWLIFPNKENLHGAGDYGASLGKDLVVYPLHMMDFLILRSVDSPFNDLELRKTLAKLTLDGHFSPEGLGIRALPAQSLILHRQRAEGGALENSMGERLRTFEPPENLYSRPLRFLVNQGPRQREGADKLKALWENEGDLKVEIRSLPWASYLGALEEGDFDLARFGWRTYSSNPYHFLEIFALAPSGPGKVLASPVPGIAWISEDFSKQIREHWFDGKVMEKEEKWEAVFSLLEEQAYLIPLFHYQSLHWINLERWKGWSPNPLGEHPLGAIRRK